MKNILVTGANGQLGNEMRVLSAEYKEYTCFFTDVAELDICDEQAVMTFVKENNIHVIVNYYDNRILCNQAYNGTSCFKRRRNQGS